MQPAQERLARRPEHGRFSGFGRAAGEQLAGQAVRTGREAREGLYQQVPNPVRWTEVIQKLASLGVRRFIEVGAGSVLSSLVRNIDSDLEASKFGEAGDLDKLYAAIA